MITVTQIDDNTLSIRSNYHYKDRIKSIPSASYDPDTKTWNIHKSYLPYLEDEFNGEQNGLEIFYKTPKWVITGEEPPDMTEMYKISDKSIKVPSTKLELLDYQKYGTKFAIDKILTHNFVILADDVGLGKTAQAIAVTKWFHENKDAEHILIIAKRSIKEQWCEEFEKFTDMGDEFWIGYTDKTKTYRKKVYKSFVASDKGILVTNYHTFLNDCELFQTMDIDFVIIDEVHEVKARNGKMHGKIKSVVNGKPTMLLTGTPITSKPEDIYGVIDLVSEDYFGLWTKFKRNFIVEINDTFGWHTIGAKHLDTLRNMVQDILIRRTVYEVSIELPEITINPVYCQMDETQEALLEEVRRQDSDLEEQVMKMRKMLPQCKADGDKEKYQKITNAIEMIESKRKGYIGARQNACSDPRIFKYSKSKVYQDMYTAMVTKDYDGSSKTKKLISLVEDITESGHKVLLFSKYVSTIRLVKEQIESKLKIKVLTYTGKEDGDARIRVKNTFWNDGEYNVLIGSEAMNAGLNLQCADYVINIDQPDTAAFKAQRIGRARRVGSAFKKVIVYDMITEDGTEFKSKDKERLEKIQRDIDLTDALVTISEEQRQALIEAMRKEAV